jgi:carboxymethylenebutenolidase
MKLESGWSEFAAEGGTARGWAARPAVAREPLPGVLVIQEAWGVDAHMRDVTERFAAAGYAAFAPDLLSLGGTPEALAEPRVEDAKAFLDTVPQAAWFDTSLRESELAKLPAARRQALDETLRLLLPAERPWARWVAALKAARRFLAAGAAKGQPVGVVGFCLGGALSLRLACADPGLTAAVVFYGSPPPLEELGGLHARVLAHYAQNDPRITSGVPALVDAMRAGHKHFEHHIYPGAQHAFFNDTRASYRVTSARHAWARTLSFLAHALHEAHV